MRITNMKGENIGYKSQNDDHYSDVFSGTFKDVEKLHEEQQMA